MEFMKDKPDNYYELSITDPPYGVGADCGIGGNNKGKVKKYNQRWDNSIPNELYFEELKRVSKNQIIWGVNYFNNLQGVRS